MDEDLTKAFENINIKLDSLNTAVQNTHAVVTEVNNQILINGKKLELILKHLGLDE